MNSPSDRPRSGGLGAIGRAARAAANAPVPAESNAFYNREKEAYAAKRQQIEHDTLAEQLENAKQDRLLRKSYANQAFRFLYAFAAFSALIIVAQGFECVPFKLPENIVVTLIGATAASVIGLVGFVARGLFKAPD